MNCVQIATGLRTSVKQLCESSKGEGRFNKSGRNSRESYRIEVRKF